MDTSISGVKQAARLLGRTLCGHISHVVAVAPRRSESDAQKFELYVYVDSPEVGKRVPNYFQGHKVHVERIGTLSFLSS